MNAALVKECLQHLSKTMSFNYPATGWYFAPEEIEDSFIFRKDKWTCMFMYLKMVLKKGKRLRFSDDSEGACTGPKEYFGFSELMDDGGEFIADVEHYKKTRELALDYYSESKASINDPKEKYLYFEQIEQISKSREIEVINLYPSPKALASLSLLSNYDRSNNIDNVVAPFASGCQGLFTIPYNERNEAKPKSVLGLMDPLARQFVPENVLVFSVPADRFIEMANNIEGSFLDNNFNNPTSF